MSLSNNKAKGILIPSHSLNNKGEFPVVPFNARFSANSPSNGRIPEVLNIQSIAVIPKLNSGCVQTKMMISLCLDLFTGVRFLPVIIW